MPVKRVFPIYHFIVQASLGVIGLSESIIDEINPHLYYTA